MPLTHWDLQRLVEGTGRPAATLVDWLGPDEVDMSGEPETFVRFSAGRRLLVLGHDATGCRLLGPTGLCLAHRVRPLPCELFPFALRLDDRGAAAGLERLPGALCEPPGEPSLPDVQALSERLARELVEYAQRVVEFNRRQGHRRRLSHALRTPDEFLGWVLDVPVDPLPSS